MRWATSRVRRSRRRARRPWEGVGAWRGRGEELFAARGSLAGGEIEGELAYALGGFGGLRRMLVRWL